jgi:hypothetical protein
LGDATFLGLVRLVRGEVSPTADEPVGSAYQFLFPINARGSRPRLFLFAGGRGCDEDFVVLAALTRALGADQPVWGVRIGGPDRLQPMHANAHAMAVDVADEIQRFQPEGPYHFAGECIGGLLAFEVARVLEGRGATVAFLGLINTGCPRPAESFRWWLSRSWIGRLKQAVPAVIHAVRRAPWRELPRHLRDTAAHVFPGQAQARPSRGDGMPDDPKDYHYGRMLLRYRPAPAQLSVHLFGCETFKRTVNRRRWARFAEDRVQLVPLAGNTTTCIREHASDSATRLRNVLDRTGSN